MKFVKVTLAAGLLVSLAACGGRVGLTVGATTALAPSYGYAPPPTVVSRTVTTRSYGGAYGGF